MSSPRIPKSRESRSLAAGIGSVAHPEESTLLDVIDNLLNKGLVVRGDVILALANIDLVYLNLSAILCAADRVFEGKGGPAGSEAPRSRRRRPRERSVSGSRTSKKVRHE